MAEYNFKMINLNVGISVIYIARSEGDQKCVFFTLNTSANTAVEFHREAVEIQCICTPMNILKGFVCIL